MYRIVFRRRLRRRAVPAARRAHYALHKETARSAIVACIAELNLYYGFIYNRIAIRAARSRWGSCSRKGNLNFNYVIASLPPALMDYVIVHELCHLAVFNHSPAFWEKVSEVLPNYRVLRRELRAHSNLL